MRCLAQDQGEDHHRLLSSPSQHGRGLGILFLGHGRRNPKDQRNAPCGWEQEDEDEDEDIERGEPAAILETEKELEMNIADDVTQVGNFPIYWIGLELGGEGFR